MVRAVLIMVWALFEAFFRASGHQLLAATSCHHQLQTLTVTGSDTVIITHATMTMVMVAMTQRDAFPVLT
jgi:hypothetical protein